MYTQLTNIFSKRYSKFLIYFEHSNTHFINKRATNKVLMEI